MQKQALKVNYSQFEVSKAITFTKFFSRIKLRASTRLVLRCLVDHWNPDKDYCFPKQNTVADETGCSRETVICAIDELRAKGLILTTGEKGDSLKYYLASKFFELLEISHPCKKNKQETCKKTLQHEQINNKQINNNIKTHFKNFQKPTEGINYESADKIVKQIEKNKETSVTPLDFDMNEAIIYLNKLPDFAKNGFYAKELRKKWNL